jgi:hypothetical protein
MNARLRSLFQEELASTPEPGIGTLVQDALYGGKKIRRTRVLYRSGIVGALGILAAGVVVVNPLAGGSSNTATVNVAGTTAAPKTTKAAAPKALRQATPEGLLVLLLQDLPDGKTSHYAKSDPADKTRKGFQYQDMAQTYLETGEGTGMVRLFLQPPRPKHNFTPEEQAKIDELERELAADAARGQGKPLKEKTYPLPDGRTVTVTSGTPSQNLRVLVTRADGWSVLVSAPASLEFDGKANQSAPVVLTEKQALKIASDPRIDKLLPADVVKQGAKEFPNLPVING